MLTARLYADEDFPRPVVDALRLLGHDVRTVQEAGRNNQSISDEDVLVDAIANQRALLTHNHFDFSRLHRQSGVHAGIISCTQDPQNPSALAARVHEAILNASSLTNHFVRIVRPSAEPRSPVST